MSPRKHHNVAIQLLLPMSALLALWAAFKQAWIADDALITLRSVANALVGNGATFNVLENVQSYTHPLWFTLMLIVNSLYFNPILWAIGLGLLLSIITVALIYHHTRAPFVTMALFFTLASLPAFAEWSTSGLENALAGVLLLLAYLGLQRLEASGTQASFRLIIIIALPIAFIVTVRHDMVFFALPLGLALLITTLRTRGHMHALMLIPVLLAPLALWTLFSIAYYGQPLPNTAIAKLNVDIPRNEIWLRGFQYQGVSLMRQPLIFLVMVLALISTPTQPQRRITSPARLALIAGMLTYLLYTIHIGGDFMEGRFLYIQLVASSALIITNAYPTYPSLLSPRTLARTLALGALLSSILPFSTPWHSNTFASSEWDFGVGRHGGVADERGHYVERGYSLWTFLDASTPSKLQNAHNQLMTWQSTPVITRFVALCFELGGESLVYGATVHVIDTCALADPTLARIPYTNADYQWRVGHYQRDLPSGYLEALRTGLPDAIPDAHSRLIFQQAHLPVRNPHIAIAINAPD